MANIHEKYCPNCLNLIFNKKDFQEKIASLKNTLLSNREDFLPSVEEFLLLQNAPLDLIMGVRKTILDELNRKTINSVDVMKKTTQAIHFKKCCFSCGYLVAEHEVSTLHKKKFFGLGLGRFLRFGKANY
ncbi:hypothetical protein RCG23_19925 [Neobacillus sp. PS3-34]|uniref:hypothetical protein n=1 Tax=Neobacillus sp. PS3-34 TaxID=3070678 RepID=UPI0027E15943|nr:hypothetical protein [Neobacillus sp. PS3-34]WML47623.1 hypothetical protein RCG23_19925 [Neobacillus sp. PS3-34]